MPAARGSATDARIVLDAFPKFVIPAHVSFIATQAQFTPKAVETKDERDKLMFRVKVRVDQSFLRAAIAAYAHRTAGQSPMCGSIARPNGRLRCG